MVTKQTGVVGWLLQLLAGVA